MHKKICVLTIVTACLFSGATFALPKIVKSTYDETRRMLSQHVLHPFYFGVSAGYGNTDWSEITTPPSTLDEPNLAALSAPIGAKSGGFAYGGFLGYQFSEHFTIEAVYTRYHQTTVDFQADDFLDSSYGIKTLYTNTSTYSLLGKIMVPFGFTHVYVYADAGITYVYRDDKSVERNPDPNIPYDYTLINDGHFGPSFGFGVAYNISEHVYSEASFQYTTGYGRADTKPAEDFIPFTYCVTLNLGVRL